MDRPDPSADQQGRVNHFHNHRLTSTSRTRCPVLQHPPQQPPPVRCVEGVHTKDLKTNYAPAAMVNWQEAGRMWPRPHPHAARLLRGLVWDQHYRHSHPQCEGGMPGSFELREDMGEDRLRAVEEWLRAEGYEYRFRRKRWRKWTRPDRPGEGLRPWD